ncbi:MAG: class I SAM-dependent methyltransferase, partial [Janthinobacterium lividum]
LGPVARLVGLRGRAVGLDLAPEMVRRTAADLADLPWVRVLVGDAQEPDLPPASFDLVASSLVLFFLRDPVAALRRWTGLLVPAGRIGVTTFGEQDPRWREIDAVFQPYLPDSLKDARTSGTRGPFGSDAGMTALLADAGLVDVRTVRRTCRSGSATWSTCSSSPGRTGSGPCGRPCRPRSVTRCAPGSSRVRPGSGWGRRGSPSPRTSATRWRAEESRSAARLAHCSDGVEVKSKRGT